MVPPIGPRRRLRFDSGGFSLVELLIVVGLMATAAGITMVALPSFRRPLQADAEMQRLLTGVRRARDLAVSERRNIALAFPSDHQLQLVRQDVSGGVVTGTTVIDTITLESRFAYCLFPGVPDTPDGFGHDSARSFSGAASVLFTSEGAFVDQTGDPVNGTLFIGVDGDPTTSRAVTVLGSTGLASAYRWNGREWIR